MKKNIGTLERIIRILLGIALFAVGFYYESLWGLVGVIPLISGISGLCPLYAVFGFSTCQPAGTKAVKVN